MDWIIVVMLIPIMVLGFWGMKKVDNFRDEIKKREKMSDDE